MKKTVLFAAFALSFSAISAHADLLGTAVHGTLRTNGSGPNLFAPFQDVTVMSGAAPEFTDTFGVANPSGHTVAEDIISIFITPVSIVIEDKCTRVVLGGCALSPAFNVSLTDLKFSQSYVFPLAFAPNVKPLESGLFGNSIVVSFNAGGPGNLANDSFTTIAVVAPPVPEPSSIVMLGTGLVGFAGTLRRRLRS